MRDASKLPKFIKFGAVSYNDECLNILINIASRQLAALHRYFSATGQ